MLKKIIYETEGKKKLAEGMLLLAKVLTSRGGILTGTGYTMSGPEVARQIEGSDPYKNQGIRLAGEVIGSINAMTGCGTRETAAVLAYLLEDYQRLAAAESPVMLADRLKKASRRMAEQLRLLAVQSSKTEAELLTEITGNPETALMIQKGKQNGELIIKESMHAQTKLGVTKGMRLTGKILAGGRGSFSDMAVLVLERKISSFSVLLPVLERFQDQRLLLVVDELKGEALTLLQANVKQGRLQVWAIEAPGMGRRKTDIMEDLAALTGTFVWNRYNPESLAELTPERLGKAGQAVVTDDYVLLQGDTESERIRKRIRRIQEKLQEPSVNFYDQQLLRERISWLSSAAPVLYAGGMSLAEAKAEKLRLEYAAAYAASIQKYGVVDSRALQDLEMPDQEDKAQEILKKCLLSCLSGSECSAWLLELITCKVSGLVVMWLTTGAVMVSAGYDREDKELINSGVDVERLRG